VVVEHDICKKQLGKLKADIKKEIKKEIKAEVEKILKVKVKGIVMELINQGLLSRAGAASADAPPPSQRVCEMAPKLGWADVKDLSARYKGPK